MPDIVQKRGQERHALPVGVMLLSRDDIDETAGRLYTPMLCAKRLCVAPG